MINYLVACASTSASTGGGCYDWPIIKQIIQLFGFVVEYIYKFLELIGIPNLGLCIILLTVVIKCVLLPLTIKQQKFTKLSSYAQPELKEIQAKYQGKRDNYSMQAMQEETKAVYAKYGISQTGGCIQSFIQFPIIIALYGVIRNIPLYVESFRVYYDKVIDGIGSLDLSTLDSVVQKLTDTLGKNAATVSTLISNIANKDVVYSDKITLLCSLPTKSWGAMESIVGSINPDVATTINTNYEQIKHLNTFLGIDLGETPWNLIIGGGIGIIAILIPIISGLTQWLSVKLGQAASTTGAVDATAASMKSMTVTMPLISVFFCFTLNSSIGLYWCISSLFQCVLQVIVNKHYRKMDMDEFVRINKEKAAEKAKKKKNKKNTVSGAALSQAANTSTKNLSTIADRANVKVEGETKASQTPPPANSLAARAALVQKYNEEHGMEDDGSRKKYKK